MNATAELPLSDLLNRAGAIIRSHTRADCPRCKRPRAVSFDESKGVFHCHGAGCDFSGGSAKLAHELGLVRTRSRQEREQLHQQHEWADRAARGLYARVRGRRHELLAQLLALNRLRLGAHEAGMTHPAVWGALALVYGRVPDLLIELTVLENCGAADLIRFLAADPEARECVIEAVLMAGGLYDSRARFVEILL